MFNAFQSNAIRTCFNHTDNDISEREFVSDINEVLAKLSTLNATSSVVLYTTDAYKFSVYLFALALHGNTVILPPNGQPETLNSLLKQTPFFIGESELIADLAADFLDVSTLANQPHFVFIETINWPEEGTIVFYTSGSSGKAKPIVKTWQVINKEVNTLINSYALIDNPIFIASVSHQHIYGLLFRLLWPLRAGKVVNTELLHYPEHVAKKLRLFKKVVLVSSPAQLKRLCIDNVLVDEKAHLQWIFSSGGPLLDEDAVSLYKQLNKPVTQVFGSTETGGIAYRQVTSLDKVSFWQPFSGIQVRAQNDQRLVLSSPLVHDKNYPLDDRGEVFQNGQFRLLGRFDRIIKLEEKRLSLDELEQHLCTSEWVSEAKVIALPGERLIVGAIIVLTQKGQMFFNSDGKLATNNLLKAHALVRFERICTPKKWRFVEQLPYNSQAKLNLKALECLFEKVD
ncbi:AMP-binding protein [Pseudoalteromonas sp. B62]|uniref:AMP-binding protein n=1 Tax=Pseudoalteromonas sp. B62 TaxID=630483 RepID=UPI00301C6044